MAGSCRRLAVCLIFAVPIFLRGQDDAAYRAPVLKPNLEQLRLATATLAPPSPILPKRAPITPDGGGFQRVVRAAGIIFSGRVTLIGRVPPGTERAPGCTAITFHVEHAIRGASAGQDLTIHEWAGLWAGGERYRLGERVLLFLYPPSRLGMTSPVSGMMGRFAMDSQGRILMNERHSANLAVHPVLGRKAVVPYSDFALAVRRASREE